MVEKQVEREILIDEPTDQDWFQGKGHERTAEALARAIKNFRDKDRSIGLDGPWGSGKSKASTTCFPKIVSELISSGDRISNSEKDNIVRHLLCVALEGENSLVLDAFLAVPRARIADYVKQSDSSTQTYLDGVLKQFTKNYKNLDFSKRIREMVHGKKKPKSWWDFWLDTGDGDTDTGEA